MVKPPEGSAPLETPKPTPVPADRGRAACLRPRSGRPPADPNAGGRAPAGPHRHAGARWPHPAPRGGRWHALPGSGRAAGPARPRPRRGHDTAAVPPGTPPSGGGRRRPPARGCGGGAPRQPPRGSTTRPEGAGCGHGGPPMRSGANPSAVPDDLVGQQRDRDRVQLRRAQSTIANLQSAIARVQFQATWSGISATSTVSSCVAPNLPSPICYLQLH